MGCVDNPSETSGRPLQFSALWGLEMEGTSVSGSGWRFDRCNGWALWLLLRRTRLIIGGPALACGPNGSEGTERG
jgi:hypothetical protein